MTGGLIKPGRSFSFNSPAGDAELSSVPRVKFVNSRTGDPCRGRILVMDDEEFILDMMGRMLRCMGYEVILSSSGEETISLYKEAMEKGEPFHCVIMDLSIADGIGGKDVIRILKEYDSSITAIISSGYPDDPVVSDFREYGFAGVSVKPYTYNELLNLLDAVIIK